MAYSTIPKPSVYFNTKLYTGNSSTNAITGVGFQPDWVWMKNRGATDSHYLYDAVRGVTKSIYSNLTTAEATKSNGLTAFGTDGFTLGNEGDINGNGNNFVSWNWKANGAGSANTDGTTSSTVSANTTADFSIVKWTGTSGNTTIGHGLGVVPSMVIAKNTGGSGTNWIVWHKSLSNGYYLKLNLTNAQDNANSYFTADPTNSILSLTGSTAMNNSGNGMIAYCFADVPGYSKFGSYVGNGNADGTFVYTGFKPAFVIIKSSSQAETNWVVVDNKREGYNPDNDRLFPDSTQAESTSDVVDLVSNGFKFRSGAGSSNATYSYIYMAFAEEPLVANSGTDGVPATAR